MSNTMHRVKCFIHHDVMDGVMVYAKDIETIQTIEYYDKGWVFRTKEECEAYCKRLNEAIEGVKP